MLQPACLQAKDRHAACSYAGHMAWLQNCWQGGNIMMTGWLRCLNHLVESRGAASLEHQHRIVSQWLFVCLQANTIVGCHQQLGSLRLQATASWLKPLAAAAISEGVWRRHPAVYTCCMYGLAAAMVKDQFIAQCTYV
jgi:hypothetical protein